MDLIDHNFYFFVFHKKMLKKVTKKKSFRSSAVSLKGHHNLSWTGGDAAKRKVSISNLKLKLFSKKFELFQLKPSENFCQCHHTLGILDLN